MEFCRRKGWPVWATNTTFRLWCDAIYACDGHWWERHHEEARATGAECWTHSQRASETYGLNFIKGVPNPGFSENPNWVHEGRNSGYQMLNLVYLMGASRILMLGYDLRHAEGKSHWHGDHGGGLQNPADKFLAECARNFDTIQQLEGCEILNCTPGSRITRFPFADLRSL